MINKELWFDPSLSFKSNLLPVPSDNGLEDECEDLFSRVDLVYFIGMSGVRTAAWKMVTTTRPSLVQTLNERS